jgi:methylglutaconyl-CoA hydratase
MTGGILYPGSDHMPDEIAHLTIAGGVATVTLDSPESRNALSRRMFADLETHLKAAVADPAVRVIVLTATGTVFCSGLDLKEQREANESGQRTTSTGGLAKLINLIWDAPKPVVARVNGPARAGGVGLVAACDISVAADTATFGFSEVRIGLTPAVIAVATLPKLGPTRGTELMLTGEVFSAARAAEYGLITAVCPAANLDEAVGDYVAKLLLGGPTALAETKKLARRVPTLSTDDAFEEMDALSAHMFGAEEAREGMTSFAEKRPPRWALPAAD